MNSLNNAQISIIQESLQFELDYLEGQLALSISARDEQKSTGDLVFRGSEIMAAQQALLKLSDTQAITIK